jgi:hypothetical protein
MFSKTDIEKYFDAEKKESIIFMVVGIAAIILGLIFFFLIKSPGYRGASVPLVIIGFIEMATGYSVYNTSDKLKNQNITDLDKEPANLKQDELSRMRGVMMRFVAYRWIEIFCLVLGMAVFYYFFNLQVYNFWKGFGLSLAIHSVIALVLDFFAETRGRVYLKGLREFSKTI